MELMDAEDPSRNQPAKRRKTFHEETNSRYLNMLTEVEAELSTEDLEKLVDIAKDEDKNFRFENTGVQPQVLANIGNNGLFTENDLSWLEAALMKVHKRDAANILCNFAYGKDDSDHDFPSEPESSNDEEEDDLPKTFEDLLECIGLVGKHYNKLTLQEFLIVRDCSTNTSLMHTFWQKITSLDHRIVLSQNLLPENISMRDFIFSLLHCSDDFLRQDILEKLSACQLAVPFLLQGVREKKPEILRWACRRIVKKWQGQDDPFSLEKSIITHPTFTVAILRIGDVYISKSQILNRMLSLCQGYDLHHFFLNSESDKVKPKYSLGTVESVWFLPRKGTDKETIKNVTTFLNLRGDCRAFPIQTEFCCKTADLTITFVSEVNKADSEEYVRNIKSASTKSLFIEVTGKETNIPDMRPLLNSQSILVGDTQINCLEHKLCEFVSECYQRDKSCGSLENVTKISTDSDIDFDDEKNENQNARKLIKDIFQSIPFKDCLEFKKKCFPLQESWQEWVQLDKTRFDSDNIREDWSFEKHREKNNTGKKNKRETQLQNHFSQTMKIFYNGIKDTENNFARSQYIFCFLHDKIQELVSEDTTKTMRLISTAENKDSGEVNRSDVQEAITNCENIDASHSKVRCENFGSEHFLREMGQLYEAYMDIYDKHALSKETADIPLFPSIAMSLALQMHPFELMDGDTGFVPITWITAVLDKMTEHLHDPRVLVISVVGVQSSGKSTLLNSMFGLRFPVRAGRCTRGLFARFMKIEENLAKELGFKYFIIVDTEGIKSIDHDDHRYDNELVTFALSIANVTIFNISGENIGPDVAGILQIAAHALMRMKEVDLECRCKIIQQRVSDLTAADRNKGSADKIKETLDEATKFAAEDEGLEGRYKEFSDVVDLKFDEDLQYVPSLWTGGMAPPNHMYGEKVIKIKRGLLQDVRNKIITPDLTLSTFTDRVRDVWSAVKEENFVFNFKDSVKAVDYNQFCLCYNEWIVQMRQAIMDKTHDSIGGVESAVEKGGSVESLITPLDDEVERQSGLLRDLVEKYVLDHPRKSMISRHKRGFLEDVHSAVKDARQQAQQRITEEYEIKKLENNLPNLGPKWLVRMITDVKEVASTTAVTEELPHANTFHGYLSYTRRMYMHVRNKHELVDLWKKWTKEIKQESGITQIQISPSDIKTLCDKLLLRMTRDMAIGSDIHNLLSKEGGIEKHIELSDCSTYINDKQVKAWMKNRATTLKEEKGPSERESKTPENKIIQYEKQKAINTMIQSIESSINELKGQKRKHFDGNVFQLLVRKTLKNLSKKTEGDIKLPNSLIAKGLMHLCGRAFNEVFQYTEVSDDNYSIFFDREEDIVKNTFGSFITQSNLESNLSEVLNYYMRRDLTKKYEHFVKNFDYSELTERFSLPWDVFEYESRYGIKHAYEGDLFHSTIFDIMAWSDDYCEYLIPQNSDGIENKEIDKLLVTVFDDLTKMENNLDRNDSYLDWIGRLLETFDIDSSVRRTNDIYDNPRPLEVSRHLKELIYEWDPREEDDCPALDHSSLKIAAGLSNVCKKTCPMCGMFCDNIMKSHTVHSSHLHRPRGMADETYPGTNRLVLEDCSSSILLPDAMCTITDKEFHCKDYKQYCPDWDVLPSTSDPGKLFWQWALVKTRKEYFDYYDFELPNSWLNITKEEALQSLIDDKQLKTEMRTNQNQHTKDDNDEQKLVADEDDVSNSEERTESDSASSNSPSEDEPESSSDDESEVVQS